MRDREPCGDRSARAIVQLDGEPAPPDGGDESRVLRERLARAPVAAHVDPRLDRASPRRRPRTAHGETETPHGHHRAELRAAAPARQSDPRDVAPAGGARGAPPRTTPLPMARGPRPRGDPPPGPGGRRPPLARAGRGAPRVPPRHGAGPPSGGAPRRRTDSLHP